MKYINYLILLLVTLSACKNPSQKKITFEDIKDSSSRAVPTKIEDNITFYDTDNNIISADKFNRLLVEGLSFSEQRQQLDGSEEVHLVNIKEHAKELEAQALPDFELLNLRGERYTNESLAGKVTILSFWFTASHFCTKDIIELNDLAQKYSANKDFIWLAPALDKAANLSRFLRGKNWTAEFAANQELLASKFGILTYPTHLIIDQEGKIFKAIIRHQKTNEVVHQSLQELLI